MVQPTRQWHRIDEGNIGEYQRMFQLPTTFGVTWMVRNDLLLERRNPETRDLEYKVTDLGIAAALLVRKDPAETPASPLARPEPAGAIAPPTM